MKIVKATELDGQITLMVTCPDGTCTHAVTVGAASTRAEIRREATAKIREEQDRHDRTIERDDLVGDL